MPDDRPYRTYRAAPPALRERLRGEREELRLPSGRDLGTRSGLASGATGRGAGALAARLGRRAGTWPARRILRWVLGLIVFWMLLSLVLFMISAGSSSDPIPASATAALTGGPNMITGTDTVLVLGTDQRPKGSKDRGANTKDTGSRTDTLMLWRIGGGTSRRLSIPRDTAVPIPGHGRDKINAAYAYGGPALTIRTVESFTGVKINHLIIVNLAAFPPFIDAVGGVDVTSGRVCSEISGGTRNGGFSLYLPPGTHHLNGRDALTLARTRHNKCNPRENDITREKRQQQILNGVKSQLLSLHTFIHLPWAAWQAPKVLRTDMGGPTLLGLFVASEIGGSAPVQVLKPTGAETLRNGGSALTATSSAVRTAVEHLMNG